MKMITHKIFYIGLLICLVSLTNKVSAQFVPMQSAQYKHLAADTLYDFTGNGAPTVHPKSYKRVVTYFDSTNGIPYWHNPKTQTWVTVSGGGGPIDSADYANLNFGYGFIIFDENPYNPATGAKAVALDTALINRYIDSVIATDTTISQNVGVFDYVVDTVSNSEPAQPDGYKYLAGTSSPNANKIGTKVGGVYTYTTPTANQSLEVRNQTQLLFYKYDGANWNLISIGDLIGGISGIYKPNIGTKDSNSFAIKTNNREAIQINETQDVFYPKFIGISSNNFAKFDTITGKFTYDVFHPFSLTTTGSSGPATFDAETGVLNVPQYSGGVGTETWEQTLQTQGATPFTTDNTVDFGGHSLLLNNSDGVGLSQFELSPREIGIIQNSASQEAYFSPAVKSGSDDTVVNAYTRALSTTDGREHFINVSVDSISIGSIFHDNTSLIIHNLDSSNADANNIMWMDANDIVHKGHITAGGGSGSGLANFYLKDSTLSSNRIVDGGTHSLTFSNLSSFTLGATNGLTFTKLTTQPATPSTGFVNMFFDSLSRLSYVNAAGYRRTYYMPYPSDQLWRFPYIINGGTLEDSTHAATTYTPQSRTLTINGTTLDLSANRSWTISGASGTIIGTPVANRLISGVSSTQITGNDSIFVDTSNYRISFGTNAPTHTITIDSTRGRIGFTIYKTSSQTTNYERLTINNNQGGAAGSGYLIGVENGGLGTANRPLYLGNTNTFVQNGVIGCTTVSAGTNVNTGVVTASSSISTPRLTRTSGLTSGNDIGISYGVQNSQTGTAGLIAHRFFVFTATSGGSGTNKIFEVGTNGNSTGTSTQINAFDVGTSLVTTFYKPISFTGSAPSIAAGTGAGTSPTVSITGNDAAGYVTITTGTSPTASGSIVTITFATALTNTPKAITLTPANANSATETAKFYVDQSTASTTSWVIKNTSSALTASTTYLYYFTVTQ